MLRAEQRVVAVPFGLRSESSLSCWFPAYDIELARYSPGLGLHLKMAEGAAATDIRCLDLGKGDEDYKQSLKNGDLMSQDEDLGVLSAVGPGEQGEPTEHAQHRQIGESH